MTQHSDHHGFSNPAHKIRAPYDWEKKPVEAVPPHWRDRWRKPLTGPEAAFWRGVVIGAVIEALVVIVLVWWLA
jgi:hypothetical protein